MYGGKFVLQNLKGNNYMCYYTVLPCFILYYRVISKCKPLGVYSWRGDLTKRFLYYECEGLIFGITLYSLENMDPSINKKGEENFSYFVF